VLKPLNAAFEDIVILSAEDEEFIVVAKAVGKYSN